MNKLRAIEYLIAAVDARSFAGAARQLGVSAPAVFKLVNALERELGLRLLARSKHLCTPTPEGELYLSAVRSLSRQLNELEATLAARGTRLGGTLRVGLRHHFGQVCVVPYLDRFRSRHPQLVLDMTQIEPLPGSLPAGLEVFVAGGWLDQPDLIVRTLIQTRYVVCASADYWHHRGVPREPAELAGHDCLAMRIGPTVLDTWEFERADQLQRVALPAATVSNHFDWLLELARHGHGVLRGPDVVLQPAIARGELVPALQDWVGKDAPPIYVAFRQGLQRSPRVRAFVDFLVEIFEEQDRLRQPRLPGERLFEPPPPWWWRWHGRLSARDPRAQRA
jgi:DNA-binding transcriptional LysR family regulator